MVCSDACVSVWVLRLCVFGHNWTQLTNSTALKYYWIGLSNILLKKLCKSKLIKCFGIFVCFWEYFITFSLGDKKIDNSGFTRMKQNKILAKFKGKLNSIFRIHNNASVNQWNVTFFVIVFSKVSSVINFKNKPNVS